MRIFLIMIMITTGLWALQVDSKDMRLAQKHVLVMQSELDAFKRLLVQYDFTKEDDTKAKNRLKIKLVTHKRMYNSAVDELARLAFTSLYNELKKPRIVQVKVRQSCGENALKVCKEKALELSKEKAIQENSAGVLNSQILLENNKLVEEKIFSQYTGTIKSFEITHERVIEDGIGYVLEAQVVIEGNLPLTVLESMEPAKIIWNFEKNFENFPTIPFVIERKKAHIAEDKLSNWLGLKLERDTGLFVLFRYSPQYHNTVKLESNFVQSVIGIKAGYELGNWSLYTKVLYALNPQREIAGLSEYYFENITAGGQIFFKGFSVGVSGGVTDQEYMRTQTSNFAFYDFKGIFLSFEASYRISITKHIMIDFGGEVGQVLKLPGNEVITNNTSFSDGLADISTLGTYALFIDIGYRF